MQIFVKGLDGRTLVINVESSSDTVDSLKAKLEELLGVPAKQQRILDYTRQLEDGHKLSDYNVKENSTLHLTMRLLSCRRCPSCSRDIYIYVETRTSKAMALQVDPSDTIAYVRKKISGHQSLFFDGNKLDDDRAFGYYHEIIQNDSTLHLDFGMQIFVKMLNGKKAVTLEVEPSDTVHDVKAKIQDQQRIIFHGNRLNNKCKLGFHKVQNLSTLHLDLKKRKRGGGMQIAVKTKTVPRSKAIRFKVQFTDKIGDLKAKIQDQQRLHFQRQELVDGDGQTLAYYNVKRKSTLRLDCPMEIFVKTYTGRTITLEVQPSNTIDDVKKRIGGHQNHLTFDGNKLDDGKTLAECNVHMGSTLHLDA